MPNRINDAIRGVKEVRLVGDNVEQGVYSFETAMRIADDMNLDLVEISPNAVPPVCRILDYQKFLYQKKRRCPALAFLFALCYTNYNYVLK